MSTVPTNNTSSGSSNIITIGDWNTQPAALTLSSPNGVSTTVAADGNGNLVLRGSMDGTNSLYKSHTFSRPILDEKVKEFHAGKYTRKYIETYLDFMVMNAMLDNLEYLEYKANLDKELS